MIFGCCDDDGAIDKHTIVSQTKNINRRKYFNVVTFEQQKRFGFTYDALLKIILEPYRTDM